MKTKILTDPEENFHVVIVRSPNGTTVLRRGIVLTSGLEAALGCHILLLLELQCGAAFGGFTIPLWNNPAEMQFSACGNVVRVRCSIKK